MSAAEQQQQFYLEETRVSVEEFSAATEGMDPEELAIAIVHDDDIKRLYMGQFIRKRNPELPSYTDLKSKVRK